MDMNEIIKSIRKFLVLSIRVSYRSICNHSTLILFSIFLLFFYKLFPSLFSFLLSTSPVLICTTLLLGTLLSFGQPNFPQIEEEEDQITNHITTNHLQTKPNHTPIERDLQIEPNEITTIQKEPSITERDLEGVFFSEEGATSYPKPDEKDDTNNEERETQEREKENSQSTILREMSELGMGRAFSLNEILLEDQIDSPQWQRIDGQGHSSDFESDGAESSSPDASMTDIIPMLEEIDPLLDQLNPKPHFSDNGSHSSHDFPDENNNDDENSNDDEEEEEEEDEEEEDEEEEEKENEKKGEKMDENAFSWTADDQKNLMDLGYSELERNQRLENLMARRRSRKNIIFDPNSTSTGTDDLSRFRVQVASISAPRSNPFDEENLGPGSAPSILNPRRNPFDIPYEQPNENNIFPRESFSPREFMNVSHQNTFFKRYDSFSHSSSAGGGLGFSTQQEKRFSRLKPYFVPDTGTNGEASSSSHNDDHNESKLDSGMDLIGDLDPVRKEGEDEESDCSDNDDVNSIDVELDHSEFESNGEREFFGSSEEKAPLVSPVPDLLLWDDVTDASSSSSHPPLTETVPIPIPREFNMMNLHSIPEEEPTEDPKPDKSDIIPDPLRPSEFDRDSDEDAERIYPEPMDESLLTELDEVGDFAPHQHLMDLGYRRVSNGTDPEQTVYNPRQHVLDASSVEEINALFNRIHEESHGTSSRDLDSGILNVDGDSGNEIPGFVDEESFSGNENHGFLEDLDSGMLVLDAKSINDIDSALEGIQDLGNGDSGLIDETESGMLIMKAKSKEDIDSVFKQVGEFLGKSNEGNESSESGMLSLDAKSVSDIETALLNATEFEGNENAGLIDETESGMLIMKAKSKEDIESVFKQVGEVLGNSNSGIGSSGFGEDSGSGIFVLDAKSIEDIDLAMMRASENMGNGDSGLIDETDSGMLIMKAQSKEEIESVFKQIGEVLGNSNPEFVEDSDSGILVLDAKSIDDINSAIMQVSEIQESENSGLIDETDSGMLVMKAKSKEDIESVFKQVSEVLGNSNPGNGNHHLVEDSSSGFLVLDANSIEDIDSAIMRVSEHTGNEDAGLVDETDSGMLVLKARSVSSLKSIFKQVGDVLGNQDLGFENPGIVEDFESGMLVLDAKSLNDIDSAILHLSEDAENEFDESDSGMLFLKARSVSNLKSVFKQVEDVLGKQDPGFAEDSESGMLVLDAKSVNDIDSAMLHMSEDMENKIEEMDSGMLALKARSVSNLKLVFKQVEDVLGKQDPGFVEDSNSGMLVLDANSLDDIDSAIFHLSEDNTESGIEETDSGMLVVKAKSKEEIEAVMKQVGEVLGESSIPGFGNLDFVEETESRIKQAEMNGSNVEV